MNNDEKIEALKYILNHTGIQELKSLYYAIDTMINRIIMISEYKSDKINQEKINRIINDIFNIEDILSLEGELALLLMVNEAIENTLIAVDNEFKILKSISVIGDNTEYIN